MKKASALYISLFLGSGAWSIACGSTEHSGATFNDGGAGSVDGVEQPGGVCLYPRPDHPLLHWPG
jgi:hypothetical protein